MLLHLNEVRLRLDGAPGAQDPRGMAARKLAADLHAVTADEAPLRNLLLVVERCYLSAPQPRSRALASALGATSEEERQLGVTGVDIGGGTTTMSMFAEGSFLRARAAPGGGNHITFDIARSLHTPLAEAERIKALYGTLVSAQSDEHETFSYPCRRGGRGGRASDDAGGACARSSGRCVHDRCHIRGEQIESLRVREHSPTGASF